MPVYKTVAKGTLYGINCVSVFHYETVTPSPSGAEQNDINESWVVDVMPALIAIQSNDFRWNCLSTNIVGAGSAEVFDKIIVAGNIGLIAEDALAPNKAYRASYYTALITANGRGRKHFSGIPESWEDDNAIIQEVGSDEPAVLLGQLQTVLETNLSGGPFGGVFRPMVYSTNLAAGQAVIKVICSPQVSVMRSRTMARC